MAIIRLSTTLLKIDQQFVYLYYNALYLWINYKFNIFLLFIFFSYFLVFLCNFEKKNALESRLMFFRYFFVNVTNSYKFITRTHIYESKLHNGPSSNLLGYNQLCMNYDKDNQLNNFKQSQKYFYQIYQIKISNYLNLFLN